MVKRWFLIMALFLAGCSQTTTPNPTQTEAVSTLEGYTVAIPESYKAPRYGEPYIIGTNADIDQILISLVAKQQYSDIIGRSVFTSRHPYDAIHSRINARIKQDKWDYITRNDDPEFVHLVYSKVFDQTSVALDTIIMSTITTNDPELVLIVQTLTTDIPEKPTPTVKPTQAATTSTRTIEGYEVAIPESYEIPTWGDAYGFGSDEKIDQLLINWHAAEPYTNILGRNVFISTDRLSLVYATISSKLNNRDWERISGQGDDRYSHIVYSKTIDQTPVAIAVLMMLFDPETHPDQVLVIQTLTTDIPEKPTPTIADRPVTATPVPILPSIIWPDPVTFYALDDPEIADGSFQLQIASVLDHVGYATTISQTLFTSSKSIVELEQFYDQAYANKVKTRSIMETIAAPNLYLGYTDSHYQRGYLIKYVIIDLADQGKPYRLILATIAE
ncbi:MAG TPA: hypothetical protein DEF47_08400 [Herpetosiphon sp.]|nr:hypothetical protein [Herpetosiphon sp.]